MSLVKISGNASGTGTLTIAAPNTNTNYTLTLPTNTGTILTTASAGSVIQTVTVNKTDTFSLSSQTWTDITGLSVSITPSSVSNKILVLASVAIGSSTDFAYIRLDRNGTVIDIGDAASNRPRVTGAFGNYNSSGAGVVYDMSQVPVMYLDSPATTSSVTYKFQMRSGSSAAAVYINRTASDRDTVDYEWRTPSNIILMEIAG